MVVGSKEPSAVVAVEAQRPVPTLSDNDLDYY